MKLNKEIDKSSVIPYYYQIAEILKIKIRNKEFDTNEFLPSENTLANTYDVSRNTIRRALNELVNEGLIKVRKGKGYYVSEPKLEQNLFRFYSLAKDFSKGKNKVVSKLLCKDVIEGPKYVVEKLAVPENSKVYKIIRNRYFNNEPLIYETSYISADKFELSGIEDCEFEYGCIYDILRDNYNIQIGNGEEYLEPIILNSYQAEKLEVEEKSPAFLVESLIYSIDHQPLEFRKSIIRGDKLRFMLDFKSST